MTVRFSRHAKRRAKLYKIPESMVIEMLADLHLKDGEYEIIKNVSDFKYPIKIVVAVEGDVVTVITNYLLKKGRKE